MFRLTMVRHGESEANVAHMLSGWKDVNLTEHGREELRRLKETVAYPASDIYFCSPLKRARETCSILFPNADPIVSEKYKEINFRSLEGYILKTHDDIISYFSSWVLDKPLKDEETITPVMERGKKMVLETVSYCLEQGLESATIVTHSGIMRSSIIALFELDKKEFNAMSVPNGLGYVLDFDGMTPISYRKLF